MAGWRSGEKPHPAVLFWCRSWLQNLSLPAVVAFSCTNSTANSYEDRSDENWKWNDLRMEEDFPCFQKSHLDPLSQWLQPLQKLTQGSAKTLDLHRLYSLSFTMSNWLPQISTYARLNLWAPGRVQSIDFQFLPSDTFATFLQIQVLNLLSLVAVAATSWVQEDFKIRIRVKNGRIPLLQTQWRLPRWLDGLTVGTVEECAFDAALLHFAPRKWEFFPK